MLMGQVPQVPLLADVHDLGPGDRRNLTDRPSVLAIAFAGPPSMVTSEISAIPPPHPPPPFRPAFSSGLPQIVCVVIGKRKAEGVLEYLRTPPNPEQASGEGEGPSGERGYLMSPIRAGWAGRKQGRERPKADARKAARITGRKAMMTAGVVFRIYCPVDIYSSLSA